MALRSFACLLTSCLVLAACTRTGDIAGDVYLTMQSGDVKRGADVEVVLISPTADFEKDWTAAQAAFQDELKTARAVAAAAANEQAARAKESSAASAALAKGARSGLEDYRSTLNQYSAASKRDFDAMEKAAKANGAVLRTVAQHQSNAVKVVQKHQIASVRTDVNGHYVTQQLQPRQYYIFSAHRVFDNTLFWFQPIEVRRGETTRRDLTGSNTGWPFDSARVK